MITGKVANDKVFRVVDMYHLEANYQERLEERIISCIAESKKLSLQNVMDLYYNSSMADKIAKGLYGMQYLDYKVLSQLILNSLDK